MGNQQSRQSMNSIIESTLDVTNMSEVQNKCGTNDTLTNEAGDVVINNCKNFNLNMVNKSKFECEAVNYMKNVTELAQTADQQNQIINKMSQQNLQVFNNQDSRTNIDTRILSDLSLTELKKTVNDCIQNNNFSNTIGDIECNSGENVNLHLANEKTAKCIFQTGYDSEITVDQSQSQSNSSENDQDQKGWDPTDLFGDLMSSQVLMSALAACVLAFCCMMLILVPMLSMSSNKNTNLTRGGKSNSLSQAMMMASMMKGR